MEKELSKANEELDQYEIESKEAEIEIASFKMKISELLAEIQKLKHKETIQEVLEENSDDEEDNNNNGNNNCNTGIVKSKKNEIFCNKFILYIKRFLIRYKYFLFLRLNIKKKLEILRTNMKK